MNQQELRDYLKAVCDAENGIFALDREVEALRSYQAKITDGPAPSKKEVGPVTYYADRSEVVKLQKRYERMRSLCVLAAVIGIILGIILGIRQAQSDFQLVRAEWLDLGLDRTWFDELPGLSLVFWVVLLETFVACLTPIFLMRLLC
ncbi:MAG: hypothetical protein IJ240_11300, partial [Clostridia bacterium]|nr:hypothetical protein [Clostridia bacterium]